LFSRLAIKTAYITIPNINFDYAIASMLFIGTGLDFMVI